MFNPRSAKVGLLVVMTVGSVGLQGCNPIIAAACIAAIPAITTAISTVKQNNDQLSLKRLEAETARTNAISSAAEKLNQQVVSQRQLELELIDKQTKTNDPAIKQQLANLQAKVAQDQQVIAQTLNTANNASTNLANDQGQLPGMGSGTASTVTAVNPPAGTTPLTPSNAANPTAPANTGNVVPTGETAPLIQTPPGATVPTGVGTGAGVTIDPRAAAAVSAAPVVNTEAPINPAAGAVPATATANTPPVFGTSSGL